MNNYILCSRQLHCCEGVYDGDRPFNRQPDLLDPPHLATPLVNWRYFRGMLRGRAWGYFLESTSVCRSSVPPPRVMWCEWYISRSMLADKGVGTGAKDPWAWGDIQSKALLLSSLDWRGHQSGSDTISPSRLFARCSITASATLTLIFIF